jgi:hypothetical protein
LQTAKDDDTVAALLRPTNYCDWLCLGAVMSDQALAAEINQFLNDYNKAFAEVDGVAIARCYHAPSITMRGDASVHVLQTHQELETFFQAVAQKYF